MYMDHSCLVIPVSVQMVLAWPFFSTVPPASSACAKHTMYCTLAACLAAFETCNLRQHKQFRLQLYSSTPCSVLADPGHPLRLEATVLTTAQGRG